VTYYARAGAAVPSVTEGEPVGGRDSRRAEERAASEALMRRADRSIKRARAVEANVRRMLAVYLEREANGGGGG